MSSPLKNPLWWAVTFCCSLFTAAVCAVVGYITWLMFDSKNFAAAVYIAFGLFETPTLWKMVKDETFCE